jgi:Ankyrin repeats (many copies)
MQVLILQLVTQSARPLRLIEIAKAIETIHGETGRDSKDVVRTACGPLLEIMEDEVVQILHHSFTEFLIDPGRLSAGTAQFPVIDPTISHRDIATTYLASLRGNGFRDYPDDNRAKGDYEESDSTSHSDRFDFRSVFLQHPLLEYAARNWPYHAKRYDKNDPEFLVALTQFSDMQKPQFRAWLGLVSRNDKHPIAARNATPLHVAASYGLSSWSEHLIKHGADVNATDSTQNTPIFWVSK